MTHPEIESAHALPEGRWLWRRLFVFASSGAAWTLLDRVVRLTSPADAPAVARGLMALLALLLVLYLVAPTAQQLLAALVHLRREAGR